MCRNTIKLKHTHTHKNKNTNNNLVLWFRKSIILAAILIKKQTELCFNSFSFFFGRENQQNKK